MVKRVKLMNYLEDIKMAGSTDRINTGDHSIAIIQIREKLEHYNKVLKDTSVKDRKQERTEMEQLILSIEDDILLEFIVKVNWGYNTYVKDEEFVVILFHVLQTSKDRAYERHINILTKLFHSINPDLRPMAIIDLFGNCYLSLYYKGLQPSECFTTLHNVWKSVPHIELKLKLKYCKSLLHHKHHQLFLQLITDNMEYFIEVHQMEYFIEVHQILTDRDVCHLYNHDEDMCCTIIMHLLISIKSMQSQSITQMLSILQRHSTNRYLYNFDITIDHFIPFINKQTLKCLINNPETDTGLPEVKLRLIHIYFKILVNQNDCLDYQQFIKQHCQFIVSMADTVAHDYESCRLRHQYTVMLLHILHNCNQALDIINTELVVSALHTSLFHYFSSGYSCYCYGGLDRCNDGKIISKLSKDETIDRWRFLNILKDAICVEVKNHDNLLSYFQSLPKIMKIISFFIDYGHNSKDLFISECLKGAEIIIKQSKVYKNGSEKGLKEIIQLLCKQSIFPEEPGKDLFTLSMTPEDQDFSIQDTLATPEGQDFWIQGLSDMLNRMYLNEQEKIAAIILDLNMTLGEHTLVSSLTKHIGKVMGMQDNISNNKNRVLYKCFCLVRALQRKHVHCEEKVAKYLEHFTFIPMFEKEEEMERMSKLAGFLVLLMLLLAAVGSNGQHKSAKLKKYLTLKYEYDDAILYLLWCSGDVEINPGPTLKKLQRLPPSQNQRKWIHEMCSNLVKLLKGISIDSKPKSLWKEQPASWPQDQPFYDPSNKSKVNNDNNLSDKQLLNCLLDQCEKTGTKLFNYMEREITAWKDGNENLLIKLFVTRQETEEIQTTILNLMKYKDTDELNHHLKDAKFKIDFNMTIPASGQRSFSASDIVKTKPNTKCKAYTEIVRDLDLTFCRIAKRLEIFEKSDGIWKVFPVGWKQKDPFYSPHNAGKRTEKGQDAILVDNLLKYCETQNIQIPPNLQTLVNAWKQRNKEEVIKIYTIWSSIVTIEHSINYLQLYNLIENSNVRQRLKDVELVLDAQAWNLPDSQNDTVQGLTDAYPDTGFTNRQLTSEGHPSSKISATGHQTSQISSPNGIQTVPAINDHEGIQNSTSFSNLSCTTTNICQDDAVDVQRPSSPQVNNKRKLDFDSRKDHKKPATIEHISPNNLDEDQQCTTQQSVTDCDQYDNPIVDIVDELSEDYITEHDVFDQEISISNQIPKDIVMSDIIDFLMMPMPGDKDRDDDEDDGI